KEVFSDLEVANRAFEQTTRGIFLQSKAFPVSLNHPIDLAFDVENACKFEDTECGRLLLPFTGTDTEYDIRVTSDVYIRTTQWPTLLDSSINTSSIRLRLFSTGNFRILFDRVVWDKDLAPSFTQGGYDIVDLRSRGDGIVRGSFILNIP